MISPVNSLLDWSHRTQKWTRRSRRRASPSVPARSHIDKNSALMWCHNAGELTPELSSTCTLYCNANCVQTPCQLVWTNQKGMAISVYALR